MDIVIPVSLPVQAGHKLELESISQILDSRLKHCGNDEKYLIEILRFPFFV